VIGLLGGAFDPPHNGHVALARAALDHFGLERLVVLVVAVPGHKPVQTGIDERLVLARLAFAELPRTEIVRDDNAYTIDSVRHWGSADAVFLIGADQFADFLSWQEPEAILDRVRLGVATRPGYPRERLEEVLAALERRERVEFFEIPAVPVSSREIRARLGDGEPIDGLVPEAVGREIARAGLYGHV
jgi:nicotinate-nucleotide adenylyltransferase